MAKRLNLKDKMEEINERFSHKNKAALANDLLENKLATLAQKMNSFSAKHQQQMSGLKAEAAQLLQQLEQNGAVYEQQAQAQLQELQQISQFLTAKVESEIMQRKDKENQLVQILQKKLRVFKNELEKEKKDRADVMEQITSTLKNDVPSLMNEVLEHSAARQQEEEKLGEIIEGELAQCEQLSRDFKQKQEQSCNKVYGLIRELTLKAKREIEEEKAIRDDTHEEVLSYIEETCNRLADN